MEQELSVLAKLYEGNEKLFDFHPKENGTKKERLFYLLREHPNKNKAFYKSQLFDEGYKGTGYEVLRSGFLSSLLQTFSPALEGVFFVDRERAYIHLSFLREISALKFLQRINHNMLSSLRGVLEVQRRKAERLGLYEEEYWLVKACLVSWKALGELRKVAFYQKKLVEVSDCLSLESQVLNVKANLDAKLVSRKNASTKLITKVEADLKELVASNTGPRQKSFETNIALLELRLLDIKRDFSEMRNVAMKLWSNKSTLPIKLPLASLAGYIYYANINLHHKSEAKKWGDIVLKLVEVGSVNWFVFKEVFVGYSLFNFRIDEAASALKEVNEVRRLNKRLPSFKVKLWELYEGFILFLWNSGQVDLELKFTRDSAHSIRRDLIQGDKTGVNVSVLVLDFLNQLNEDQYESLIDLEDSLARYVSRNFKGEENQRPKIFIGMLMKVIQLDFNAFEVEKKTRRQLEKLKAMKPNLNMNMGGNEIIRYEVLWEWILKKLKESSLLPKSKS